MNHSDSIHIVDGILLSFLFFFNVRTPFVLCIYIYKQGANTTSFFFLNFPKVNMMKEDGQVIHFNNPKVQASLGANTFAITGLAENKGMNFYAELE